MSTESPAPALVLFDIDGTLIRGAGPHHKLALVEAIRRVAGVETSTDSIPVQGMLDPVILTLMLQAVGIGRLEARRLMPDLIREAQNVYVRTCPDLRSKVCPGVRDLLGELRRRGIPAGLVTGNLPRIAWKKLERAGLKRFFRFGAFSDQGGERSVLVRAAIRHARREGWINASSRIALIGDHENDIRAAQRAGIKSVAVATGLSTAGELAACHPDLLVADLTQLQLKELV